jgi:hypothetical protein
MAGQGNDHPIHLWHTKREAKEQQKAHHHNRKSLLVLLVLYLISFPAEANRTSA